MARVHLRHAALRLSGAGHQGTRDRRHGPGPAAVAGEPGTIYSGRSIYLTFGLEGVNPPPPAPADRTQRGQHPGELRESRTTLGRRHGLARCKGRHRRHLVDHLCVDHRPRGVRGRLRRAAAWAGSCPVPVGLRRRQRLHDLGEQHAGHQYVCSPAGNTYTVRVEVTDSLGMVAIGSKQIDVTNTCVTEPTTIETFVSAVDH